MPQTPHPRILLGVSGGIAAYKSVELVRRLTRHGCAVRVVMTAAATEFVSPLTFQAVSGQPVRTTLFDPAAETGVAGADQNGMDHIGLARWADALLIAPASADLIARLAAGLGNDLLTTLALASAAPLYLAPAMNQQMWRHPATQHNLGMLRARGARVFGPADGAQACGESGPGRMLEADEIATLTLETLRPTPSEPSGERLLANVPVLLTAGPTREPLDPVRYLGNRSSGKMGYALTTALTDLGARVTLITGPSVLTAPAAAEVLQVETALQMHQAVMERVSACALFVATAAVADYRVAEPATSKIKKQAETLDLRLVRNPDILAEVAACPKRPFCVGFAAETHEVEAHARAKLAAKRLDMIAANQVGASAGGFEHDDNALAVFWANGRQDFPLMPKTRLAEALAALIGRRFRLAHPIAS